MVFINTTDIIGVIIGRGTDNATGSLMATLLFLLAFLLVLCFMFQIPMEFASIILLPICLACGAYYTDFFKPLIVIIIYVSMVIAKNWLFR